MRCFICSHKLELPERIKKSIVDTKILCCLCMSMLLLSNEATACCWRKQTSISINTCRMCTENCFLKIPARIIYEKRIIIPDREKKRLRTFVEESTNIVSWLSQRM